LTHFVDFHIKFTLREWMGRVKRAHIIFSHDDWGAAGGQGIGHRRAAAPLPPRWRRPWQGRLKTSAEDALIIVIIIIIRNLYSAIMPLGGYSTYTLY